ncbi:hypothetical protein [Vitiosangium sp. GDMCC 1.1324]|uniref:hypothetical protein n=1 Tax=Vitiosangium sp. (strain GDMCC 1.1324) TaxID=2138576 RepID=UPI000D3D0519|nr:hypothetical protein [Vitiosangium sp. GDMCC 1.1324]PTL78450.1 hypothetical protein DAT35_38615 [Vitiosangium sp. GDMCC 1.1324]
MCRNPLLLLLVLLTASAASAQDDEDDGYDEEEAPPILEGSGRISFQTGWRYTPNTRFYDEYYSQTGNLHLERSEGAIGGPLLAATFAYSPLEWLELGIDLSATYERMQLTGKPGLNAMTLGALAGLRLQKRLEIGPAGLVPWVGVILGNLFAASYFDGGRSVETAAGALGGTVGATLSLGETWGLTLEYRQILAKGEAEKIGVYDAVGNWFSVGVTYLIPSEPDRPMKKLF